MKKPSGANRYDGLLEPWKVHLITSRAKRLGFRRHDLEDARQEVALAVNDFHFDATRGAAESTGLTILIDNRLKALRRKAKRYSARVRNATDTAAPEPAISSGQADVDLRLDVLAAEATLNSAERTILSALAQGQSIRRIARRLGRGWHSVNRVILKVQDRFRAMGLED